MRLPDAHQSFLPLSKEKNRADFSRFYDQYAPAFYGDIQRMIHLQNKANEVLANAFVTIWNSIDQYDPAKERLFTWSLKVVRKEACRQKVTLALNELFACRQQGVPTRSTLQGA